MKKHQMFFVHTTPEEVKNAAITGHFGFEFGEKSRDNHDVIISEKLRFKVAEHSFQECMPNSP